MTLERLMTWRGAAPTWGKTRLWPCDLDFWMASTRQTGELRGREAAGLCPQLAGARCRRSPSRSCRRYPAGRGGLDHVANLLLTLGPEARHSLPLLLQVLLHVRKLLDDSFETLPETRSCQILVYHLHLGVLALGRLSYEGDL